MLINILQEALNSKVRTVSVRALGGVRASRLNPGRVRKMKLSMDNLKIIANR